MPALSFMKQFVPAVERGDKTHSVRGKRSRPWKVGDNLALYYAMRTKQCRLLYRTTVTKVEDIMIQLSAKRTFEDIPDLGREPYPEVEIDGVLLSDDEMETFAKRDGFKDLWAFTSFWRATHGIDNEPFHGDVIHWKYMGEV